MSKLIFLNLKKIILNLKSLVFLAFIFLSLIFVRATFKSQSTTIKIIEAISVNFFFLREQFFITFILFFSLIIFVGISIVTIYLRPKEDGSLLLITTKSIKKQDIVFGNIISIGLIIAIFVFQEFVFDLLSSFISKNKVSVDFVTSFSRAFGNILIGLIFASFLLLLSSFVKTKSMIFSSLLIAVVVPMSSIGISLVGNVEMKTANKYKYSGLESDENIFLDLSSEKGEIYQSQEIKERGKSSYDTLVYFDPWYQLSSLYSLLSKSENTNAKWAKNKTKISKTNLKINNKNYKIVFSEFSKRKDINNKYSDIAKKIISDAAYMRLIKNNSSTLNNFNFQSQINFVNWMIQEQGTIVVKNKDVLKELNLIKNNSKINILDNFSSTTPTSIKLWKEMIDKKYFKKSNNVIKEKSSFRNIGSQAYMFRKGQTISTFYKDTYLNRYWVFAFWTVISLIMFALVIYFENKKPII